MLQDQNFRGRYKIVFNANKKRIVQMVNQGYPVAEIQRSIPSLQEMSYQLLIRYINKYIRDTPASIKNKSGKPNARTIELSTFSVSASFRR